MICDAYSGVCVSPPATTTSTVEPTPLPRTGTSVGDFLIVALLLLLIGALVLAVARRFPYR